MKIEEILMPFKLAAIRNDSSFSSWPLMALSRYICSGRSSANFERALVRANADKLTAAMIAGDDRSDDGLIAACKKYLKRYCGYRQE